MASRKQTPERSRIARTTTRAFARRQRTNGDDDDTVESAPAEPAKPGSEARVDAIPERALDARFDVTPAPAPPEAKPAEATSVEARTVEPAPRSRAQATLGSPPELPVAVAPSPRAPTAPTTVENPTHMPGPREIPDGDPTDRAAPPGVVPRGDSRSLRRYTEPEEFALIYRQGSFVISRFGVVGTRGQWRVVEYPTPTSASHSYAKECSRFVSEGFSDYRD
jgi:hypothetical protein